MLHCNTSRALREASRVRVNEGRRMAREIWSHETDLFVDVQFAEYFGCVEKMLVVEDPGVPRR